MDSARTRLKKRRGGLNGKTEDKVRAGQIGGKNASPEGLKGKIQSGIDNNALLTRADCVLGGRVGCHMRWHVKRQIVRDTCEFCVSEPREPKKYRLARKKAAAKMARAKRLEVDAATEPPSKPIIPTKEELKAARDVCGVFIRDHRLSVLRQKLNCTWAKAVAVRRALVSFCQG